MDTELDFHFGRMSQKGIDSLNGNVQDDPAARTYEGALVGCIGNGIMSSTSATSRRLVSCPRSTHGQRFWGFKIRKIERFDPPIDENGIIGKNAGDGMRFGIVVTLRGMDGRNHYDEFNQHCQFRGAVDCRGNRYAGQYELYREADVEIDFEDDDNGDGSLW